MWYYYANNLEYGPIDDATLADCHAKGVINATTLVREAEDSVWRRLEETTLTDFIEVSKDNPNLWQSCAFSGERHKRYAMDVANGFWVAKAHRAEAAAHILNGGWLPTQQSGCRAQGRLDLGHLLRQSFQLLMMGRTLTASAGFFMLVLWSDIILSVCNNLEGLSHFLQAVAHLTGLAIIMQITIQVLSAVTRSGTAEVVLRNPLDFTLKSLGNTTLLFLPLTLPLWVGATLQPLSSYQVALTGMATACFGMIFALAAIAVIERQLTPSNALQLSQNLISAPGSMSANAVATLSFAALLSPSFIAIMTPEHAVTHRMDLFFLGILSLFASIPLFICYKEMEAKYLATHEPPRPTTPDV